MENADQKTILLEESGTREMEFTILLRLVSGIWERNIDDDCEKNWEF